MNISLKTLALLFLSCVFTMKSMGQDSTASTGEYPYVFPMMGKQAHKKGYRLQLPHGIMANGLFNKQGIVLSDFQMDFTTGGESPDFSRLQPLSDLIVFGPSEGFINTFNVRFDTWILPFLSIAGYYGRVYGDQTVTLTAPIPIESKTDIIGQYYGFNILAVAPLGPVNLAVDYSWNWTTNERLDEPVLVEVSGMRLIRQIKLKNHVDRFFAVWGGAQFQKLASETSGKISLNEALGIDSGELIEDKINEIKASDRYQELGPAKKAAVDAALDRIQEKVDERGETIVHYRFQKDLEFDWNMVIGGQFQYNQHWQARVEYGFLQSKQQVLLSVNYRFGL